MIFIDAGHLIGLIDAGDELSSRARAWDRRTREPLITTNYITVEVMNHFSATPLKARSHLSLPVILTGVEVVHVDQALHLAAITLHRERPDKAWSLTDCVSFVLMERRGIARALAYDHHFEQSSQASSPHAR